MCAGSSQKKSAPPPRRAKCNLRHNYRVGLFSFFLQKPAVLLNYEYIISQLSDGLLAINDRHEMKGTSSFRINMQNYVRALIFPWLGSSPTLQLCTNDVSDSSLADITFGCWKRLLKTVTHPAKAFKFAGVEIFIRMQRLGAMLYLLTLFFLEVHARRSVNGHSESSQS